MRKIILGVLLLLQVSTKAATYYFSATSGSDSRSPEQAQNQNTPWQSIDKLNTMMSILKPGDKVLFKRGDVFAGSLVIKSSGAKDKPIFFGAYGAGTTKPVFDGRIKLTSWRLIDNNIWQTSNTTFNGAPTALMINNRLQAYGRYPNSDAKDGGYLTISSHPVGAKNEFVDDKLPSIPNWIGAEAVIRTKHWTLERRLVTTHVNTTIELQKDAAYEITDNFGYFFQNHPLTLDREGEWAFFENSIFLYSQKDPKELDVKVTFVDQYISISNQEYLVIDGLDFRGAKTNAIYTSQVNYLSIQNCNFWGSGINAITIIPGGKNGIGNAIVNNEFQQTQNNCIVASGDQCMISGNTIRTTACTPGMAQSGQNGMAISADAGITIERNTIDSTGYIPIRFGGSNILINENVIRYFCFTIDDGGGIYTWSDGKTEPINRKVTNNIVLYGIGAPAGTNRTSNFPAEGIYIDDRSPNVEVNGNSVAYCSNNGIYIHNARKCSVKNNIVFGCSFALKIVHDNIAPSFPVVDCDIQNNVLASNSLDASKTLMTFQTRDTTTLAKLGILENNIYCHPFQKEGFIRYIYNPLVTKKTLSLNLEEWRSFSGYDQQSKLSPRSYSLSGKINSPNLITNGLFSINTSTWSKWDPAGNSSILDWNKDQMDGGCLSFSVSSNNEASSRIQTLLPPITKGKEYSLKMSVKASQKGTLNAYFIQNIAPYPVGSKSYVIPSGNKRRDIEMLITATMTQEKPSLFITVGPEDGTVFLDNMELNEVTPVNPDNYVRFEFNSSSKNRSIIVDQNYTTARGGTFFTGNTVVIPPFSSVVLLRLPEITKTSDIDPVAPKAKLTVYPNPLYHEDELFIQLSEYPSSKEVHMAVYDFTGRLMYQQENRSIQGVETGFKLHRSMFIPGAYVIKTWTPDGFSQAVKFLVK